MKQFTLINTNSFAKHLSELRKLPMLSIEEQQIVAEKAVNGCEKSRELLIQSNLRLVVTIAKKYRSDKYEFEDLLAVGNLGVTQAFNSYKLEKGNFASWAHTYIIRNILNFIANDTNTIKLTKYHQKTYNTEPTPIDYFSEIKPGFDSDTFEDMLPGSIEQENDEDSRDYNDNLVEVLKNNISKLKPIEQKVITLHYMQGKAYKEIGEILGKTREAIRVTHNKAIKKLKDYLTNGTIQ